MLFGKNRNKDKEAADNSKKLTVNCATCDLRGVSEQTLKKYDLIKVNCALALSSPEARERMNGYNVEISAAATVDAPEGTKITTCNGKTEISAASAAGTHTVLIVNGKLNILPGSEEALKSYVSIIVNGVVSYPRGLAPYLNMMTVNGKSEVYPDGAVILKKNSVIDKVFVTRARSPLYYCKGTLVISDPTLDLSPLVNAAVRIEAKKVVVCEALLEPACRLFPEETEIKTVPNGCAVICDDATLNEELLIRNGDSLYISGGLSMNGSAAALLAKIKYLEVDGEVRLPRSAVDAFVKSGAKYADIKTVRDVCFVDRIGVSIDSAMLGSGDGVSVIDCVKVTIAKDVTPELIREKLEIADCVNVRCSPAQRSAVELVSSDIVKISDGTRGDSDDDNDPSQIGDMLEGMLGGTGKNGRVVNAVEYKL